MADQQNEVSERYAEALRKIADIVDSSESDPERMRLMLVAIAQTASDAIA